MTSFPFLSYVPNRKIVPSKYQHVIYSLTEMDTPSREGTVKLFCFPSEKGSTLKGKNLLPLGANSFLLE